MRQLLTHTSGFSYEFSDPVLLQWSRTQPNRNVSRLQWSKLEVTTPLRFAPGQSWGYGVGLDWAGQVLEALTGKSLGQYMQENILDPVGLNDTGFWPERIPHTAPRTAQNVQRTKDGKLAAAHWPTPEKHEIESGGGGWFTTASDYGLFLRAFLTGRLVSEETMREMVKPQLNEAQAEFLRTIAFHPMVHNTFAPEFKPGTNIDHGLGGMLNVEDVPGKRKAGSIAWSGILNSRWVSYPPPCFPFSRPVCQNHSVYGCISRKANRSFFVLCSGLTRRRALQVFLLSMFGPTATLSWPSYMMSWSLLYMASFWDRLLSRVVSKVYDMETWPEYIYNHCIYLEYTILCSFHSPSYPPEAGPIVSFQTPSLFSSTLFNLIPIV